MDGYHYVLEDSFDTEKEAQAFINYSRKMLIRFFQKYSSSPVIVHEGGKYKIHLVVK